MDACPDPRPFRERLGLVLCELRRSPSFASLGAVSWNTFVAIACRWQAQAEAWPSQHTIAAQCGFSPRSIRRALLDLEQRGLVHLRREPGPQGSTRIYYSPGPVTQREISALRERLATRAARAQLADTRSAAPREQADPGSAGKRIQGPQNLRNRNLKDLVFPSQRESESPPSRNEASAGPPRVAPRSTEPRVEGQLTPEMMSQSLAKLFGPNWRH